MQGEFFKTAKIADARNISEDLGNWQSNTDHSDIKRES